MALSSVSDGAEKITFEQHVQPIFRQHCQACHSQDDASAGLALDDYNATLAGGAGGEVLASADVDGSRLWKLVNQEEQPFMPPGGDKLPEDQLKVLRAWIEGGLLKDAGSKPKPSAKPAIAEVVTDDSGRPQGEPAMPTALFRQPVVTAPHAGPVVSLAASRWAPLVAVPWQRQVSFYHTQTHELLGVVPYVDGAPRVVRFSRDGSLLLAAGGRSGALGNAALYDVKTGARLATLGDELDTVLAADISPDKSLVAIGGPKKKVRVYRTADGSLAYELTKHTDWITALAFSPHGKLLATGDRSAGLRTWDALAGHERGDLRGHKEAVTSIAWRADSSVMASASEDGALRLWNRGGNPIKSINAHGGGVLSVDFAPDGKIVTAGRDQKLKLWKPDGGALTDLAKLEDTALAAVFTDEGARVAVADYKGNVRLCDVATKKSLATLPPNPPTLEERLAELESKVGAKAAQRDRLVSNADTAAAALDEGRAAHERYQQRLADAEAQFAEAENQRETRSASFQQAKSELAHAEGAVNAANEQLALTEQAVVTAQQQAADDQSPPAKEVLTKSKTELVAAQAAAQQAQAAFAEAQSKRSKAQRQFNTAKARLGQAENLLADVSNQQAGLPDLAALKKSCNQAIAAARQASGAAQELTAARDAVAEELQAFAGAFARLTDRSAANAQQHTELAQAFGAAEANRAAALSAIEEQTAAIDRLHERLKELETRLRSLRQQKVELASQLDESDARLAETRRRLNKVERDAQVAEALLRDFTAAAALRDAYAEREQ